jgi:hypothetical protein
VVAYVNKSSTVNSSSTTSTVITTPAGTSGSGNQRAVAILGVVGTANEITDPTGATWIKLGEYAPATNFKTAAYYRDITGTEAGSYTWGWTVGGRNFGHIVLYSDVDRSSPPVFAVQSGTADAAGPHNSPGITVSDGGWLITAVGARQSPGTAGQVSWTTGDASDAERYDNTAVNTGTGAQLPSAFYDSNRALSAAGGGGSTLPPGAAPLNKYNDLYAGRGSMLVGQTNAIDNLEAWRGRIAGLDLMRIFPNSGMMPPWTDARVQFVRDYGGQCFFSTKVDGDDAKIQETIDQLNAMPSWITADPNPNKFVWITDRHEPEGDVTVQAYRDNITEYINKLKAGVTGAAAARLKVGPILTRQWTENTAGRSYATHDPGIGDFFGVDAYVNSWQYPLPNPVTFLSIIKGYKYSPTDTRPRILPELGAIGFPQDTDGTLRAAWMQGVQDELKTWTQAAQGWPFVGWCWWNEEGKSGATSAGIGTRRWFQLDRIHNGEPYTYYDSTQKKNVTDPEGGYAFLPVVGSGSGGGSGGSTATRTLTASAPVGQAHVWAIALAPAAGSGGATGNAWSYAGRPL